MTVSRFSDPQAFLASAAPLLFADEAKYNRIIGQALATNPNGSVLPYMAVASSSSGHVTACCFMPLGKQLEIVEAPPDAIAELARFMARDTWSDRGSPVDVRRVGGPPEASLGFARTWCGERGTTVVPKGPHGIYRCDLPIRPDRLSAGTLDVASLHDADSLVPWMDGFIAETGLLMPSAEEYVLDLLSKNRLYLLRVDGRTVCMGGISRTTPHGAGLAYVYSPPEYRRRGYATTLAYQLTVRLLESGFGFCFLYTDLDNPTTNGIYRGMGYRLIAEFHDYELAVAT